MKKANPLVQFVYIPQIIFYHTRDIINEHWYNLFKNTHQQFKKKVFVDELEKDFISIKKIYVNKYEHPTGNIATNFLKPAGKGNPHLQFGNIQ